MDLHVIEARLAVNSFRIAEVLVRHHSLGLYLDVCLYKEEKLLVSIPEIWIHKKQKKKFGFWFNKTDYDECQRIVLNKVFDMLGLDLETAIKEQTSFFDNKKKLTVEKNNVTL